MVQSTNLDLPYIQAAQAQKHVTHNEALRALDAIVQLSVLDRDLAAPPGSPAEGDRYLIAASPTGAWAGQAGSIAAWQDGAWSFYSPGEGWVAWVADENALLAFDGSTWGSVGATQNVPMFGINATADTTNRLTVASAASLFDNVGNGHQHKINKAAAGDTASMLYQTNYSGRAEIGLTGDDKFRFKVSPNGSSWTDAIVIDPTTGYVGIGTAAPEGPLHIFRTAVSPLNDRVDDTAQSPAPVGRKARGTVGAKTALISGDVIQGFFGQGYDGSAYVGAANLRWTVDGSVGTGSVPTKVEFQTFTSGGALTAKLEITNGGTTRPSADNAYQLGDATNRWSAVYAANGTIQTSDARDKSVVGDLSFAGQMVDAVDPVLFTWKVGGYRVVASQTETEIDDVGDVAPKMVSEPVAGSRTHAGFLAQDLKAAMDTANVDFAAWGLDDREDVDSRQWTRPDQLVAVLWAALKETRMELAAVRDVVSRGLGTSGGA